MYDVLAEHYKTIGQTKLARRYNNLNIQLNIASGIRFQLYNHWNEFICAMQKKINGMNVLSILMKYKW